MIKDFILSFRENFREKTTNPFLGTYAVVWIIRNWELVYTLFNFDKTYTLAKKVQWINDYYSDKDFIEGLLFNILATFTALILSYLVLNLSRVIVNLSEKRLTPWIYLKTDSKSIVKKEVFELLRNERDDLQQRLDQERDSKSRLESRIKNLQEELLNEKNKKTEHIEQPLFLEPSEGNDDVNQNEIVEEKETEEKFTKQFFEQLKSQNLIRQYLSVTTKINKGQRLPFDDITVDPFVELGLIKFVDRNHNARILYSITSQGEIVLNMARANSDK